MLILFPSCFAACGHHLSPRIAIVFSSLSSVPNELLHVTFFHFPHLLTDPAPPCTFHILPLRESTRYCFAIRAHLCIYFLRSATGIPLFLLADPGHLHEIAVSASSRSPLGCANKFISYIFSRPLGISQLSFILFHLIS